MNFKPVIRGLYAVTSDISDTAELLSKLEAALKGGVSVVQYRNKTADEPLRRAQAEAVVGLTRRYATPLIVNDDVALAIDIGAAGAHVGLRDGAIADYRRRYGKNIILGATCHNRLDLAEAATLAGASYLAFGRFFPSTTKPGDCFTDLASIKTAKIRFGLPIVAIGGITPENAKPIVEGGIDAIAVVAALFNAPDIQKTAARLSALFDTMNG